LIGLSSETCRASPRLDGGGKVHFPGLAGRREGVESRLIPGLVATATAVSTGLLLVRLMF